MKHKHKKGPNHSGRPIRQRLEATEMLIENISNDFLGEHLILSGLIDRISQTSGPTLFSLNDGTGTLLLKGFEGAGVRAHASIEEGDYVSVTVSLNEYNDAFEGEILKISKLSESQIVHFRNKMDSLLTKKATPEEIDFLVKSPILEKLKPYFIKAATEIRKAILQNRPIIVRHHNDTDGYSSGFSLERAILPLIEKHHGGGKSAWEFYTRAPCAAPFYEIEDSIKDTSNSLRNAAKFSNKMPLVVIVDNGSSPEDLFGIQQGKVHGIDFIVVDHHFFDEDVISKEVLVHVSPFLVGEDGAKFSAGMLCTELARFINPVKNIEQIPAMAGLADRIDNPDVMNAYLKIAEEKGYSKKLLEDISLVIDFVSSKLRFMEAREYIEVVFGEPVDRQKELVSLMAPYIKRLESAGLEVAKSAHKVENLGKVSLAILPIEETFPRGFYPKPGRCVGILHDYLKEELKTKGIVSIGLLQDAVTIRATDEANFSVHDFLNLLNKKVPKAFAEGGGHKNAGSIKFVPSQKDKVVEMLKSFIESRN